MVVCITDIRELQDKNSVFESSREIGTFYPSLSTNILNLQTLMENHSDPGISDPKWLQIDYFGRTGVKFVLTVVFMENRRHLPVIELRRVA